MQGLETKGSVLKWIDQEPCFKNSEGGSPQLLGHGSKTLPPGIGPQVLVLASFIFRIPAFLGSPYMFDPHQFCSPSLPRVGFEPMTMPHAVVGYLRHRPSGDVQSMKSGVGLSRLCLLCRARGKTRDMVPPVNIPIPTKF